MNRAIQFAQFFPDPTIVSTLSTQLSWSHFIELLPIKDPLAREFYKDFLSVHGERAHRRERAGIVAEVVA